MPFNAVIITAFGTKDTFLGSYHQFVNLSYRTDNYFGKGIKHVLLEMQN